VTELERDFTFSLTKYPSLIFVFLVVKATEEAIAISIPLLVILFSRDKTFLSLDTFSLYICVCAHEEVDCHLSNAYLCQNGWLNE